MRWWWRRAPQREPAPVTGNGREREALNKLYEGERAAEKTGELIVRREQLAERVHQALGLFE